MSLNSKQYLVEGNNANTNNDVHVENSNTTSNYGISWNKIAKIQAIINLVLIVGESILIGIAICRVAKYKAWVDANRSDSSYISDMLIFLISIGIGFWIISVIVQIVINILLYIAVNQKSRNKCIAYLISIYIVNVLKIIGYFIVYNYYLYELPINLIVIISTGLWLQIGHYLVHSITVWRLWKKLANEHEQLTRKNNNSAAAVYLLNGQAGAS